MGCLVVNIVSHSKKRSGVYENMNYDFFTFKYFLFLSFVNLFIVYLFEFITNQIKVIKNETHYPFFCYSF
ncbi:MAG: hypothetical protein DBY16_09175 [Coprobacter sp.]|nr:MAG: hypothetical protein DBY16_09175 [Coprobacter sp.]